MNSLKEATDETHDVCEEKNQQQEPPISACNRRVFRKCSIPEQIETLRQNGLHKLGSAASYRQPLFPPSKHKMSVNIIDDYHPWSCKRHCSLPHLASTVAWNPSRIRNMMLAVGPGTPAHVLWVSRDRCLNYDDDVNERHRRDIMTFSDDDEADDDEADDDDDDDDDEGSDGDEGNDRDDNNDGDEGDEGDDDDGDNEEEDNGDDLLEEAIRRRTSGEYNEYMNETRTAVMHQFLNWVREQESRAEPRASRYESSERWLPSIRHGGCINTACWLNVPWRLSLSSTDCATSTSSNGQQRYAPKLNTSTGSCYEIPTQLVTSGDDCMIKVWDVKNSMGTTSPLAGGWDTFKPLTVSSRKDVGSDDTYKSWVAYYNERDDESHISGSVKLLATMQSGHRANVFYVQPLSHKPGNFLTCGADGFLRLSDIESSSSVEVFNPGTEVVPNISVPLVSLERFKDRMAYSFQLLSQNTGVLCTDRGLYHFDIRLQSREQNHSPLYQAKSCSSSSLLGCKACAVWKPYNYRRYGSYPDLPENEIETPYVFAGGSGEYVELLDLRMLNGSSSNNVLERYCPEVFKCGKPKVSVSGIDVTRDGRELLVSYENDQIYTFKIFGGSSCRAGPSSKEIDESREWFVSNDTISIDYHAMYGGHVNCVTFLKQTTYAGPNDEYILTGGDTGKVWIYERSTGAVAAMLNADRNACNGIVPHPILPYFISYGIDNTAKLWRAPPSQDSPLARAEASVQRTEFEPSPVSRNWNEILSGLSNRTNETPLVFPDVVLTEDNSEADHDVWGHEITDISDGTALYSAYGNARRCVEFELNDIKSRYFNSQLYDSTEFLSQGLHVHSTGISWRRLQSQATRLGMRANMYAPWVFERPISMTNPISGFHKADLVPDYPSDWMQYHPLMQNVPFPDAYSNWMELLRASPEHDATVITDSIKKISLALPWLSDELQQTYLDMEKTERDSDMLLAKNCDKQLLTSDSSIEHQPETWDQFVLRDTKPHISLSPRQNRSLNILEETIDVLKLGGNDATKSGLFFTAAHRYDKAINYCAIALMPHMRTDKVLGHFTLAHLMIGDFYGNPSGARCKLWSPIARNLLAIRLNLSLLMLKPELNKPTSAYNLAVMVLGLVQPFTKKIGKVIMTNVVSDNEPIETYLEAKAIESKAFFRLGCASYDLKDYAKAVKSFQSSLDCFNEIQKVSATTTPDAPPRKADAVLLRRLHDAKLQLKKKKERTNEKFRSAFGASSPAK